MGKSESKDHVGFERLDSVQEDLKAYLRSDPSFDAKSTLKRLTEGVKYLKDAVELASKEKESIERKVKEKDATLGQRDERIAQLEGNISLLQESVARCQEQAKKAEQERDAALRSVAERDRDIKELEVRSKPTNRFKGLATNNPDLGSLFQDIETSGEAFKELQDPPSSVCEAKQAKEEEVIQALRDLVKDIEEDGADRETLKLDLTRKKPLQALMDLVAQCQQQETNSDIGKVVGALGRNVQEILHKYEGDKPLFREDVKIKQLINTYIHGTIKKLQDQRESSHTLQLTKDGEEMALAEEIRLQTNALNQTACGNRGRIEEARIEKVEELARYYVDQVKSVMSEDKAAKLLEENRREFCFSLCETRDEYEQMQKTQDDCIKDLQLRKEDLGALEKKCVVAYKKEKRLYKWVAMATRLLQRYHVSIISKSLAALLETVAGLSNASAIRDECRIVCEEAETLCPSAKRRLVDAAELHKKGQMRLKEATDLMRLFENCVLAAFDGLMDKVKQDRLDLETNQPLYGAKWLVVHQQLRVNIADFQATVRRLHKAASEKYDKLEDHVNEIEYLEVPEDEFNKKKEELEAEEKKRDLFEARFQWLVKKEKQANADQGNPAEQIARKVPPSLLEEAQRWFYEYHPVAGPQSRRNLRGMRPALEGGRGSAASRRPLQIEDGQASNNPRHEHCEASSVATTAATTRRQTSTSGSQEAYLLVDEQSPRHEGPAAIAAATAAVVSSIAAGGEGDGLPATAAPAAPSSSEAKAHSTQEEEVVVEKACDSAMASANAEARAAQEDKEDVEEKVCDAAMATGKAEEEATVKAVQEEQEEEASATAMAAANAEEDNDLVEAAHEEEEVKVCAAATAAAEAEEEELVKEEEEEEAKASANAIAAADAEEENDLVEAAHEEEEVKVCAAATAAAEAEEEELVKEPASTTQEADETGPGEAAVAEGVVFLDAEDEACLAASDVADVMEAGDEEEDVDCVINLSSEHDDDCFVDVQLMSS